MPMIGVVPVEVEAGISAYTRFREESIRLLPMFRAPEGVGNSAVVVKFASASHQAKVASEPSSLRLTVRGPAGGEDT